MKRFSAALLVAAVFAGEAFAEAPHTPIERMAAPPFKGEARPFSSAVRAGDMLYLSGQIGRDANGQMPAGFDGQAHQAMDNIGAVLKRAGLGWGDVVHCTVMLSDMANWPAFNKVYVTYFPAGELPARSAFGANGLAFGALVEVECQAYAGKK